MKIDASARDALKVTNMPNDRLCSILTLGSAAGLGRSADDISHQPLKRFTQSRSASLSGQSHPTTTTEVRKKPSDDDDCDCRSASVPSLRGLVFRVSQGRAEGSNWRPTASSLVLWHCQLGQGTFYQSIALVSRPGPGSRRKGGI